MERMALRTWILAALVLLTCVSTALPIVMALAGFLVTKDSHLEDGEAARARRWGEDVGRTFETLVSRPGGRRSNR